MHGLIFENQSELGLPMLLELAESMNLDMKAFQKDFKDPKLFAKVEADFESGIVSGVNGTPSFYINGIKYDGAYEMKSLSHEIDQSLKKQRVAK